MKLTGKVAIFCIVLLFVVAIDSLAFEPLFDTRIDYGVGDRAVSIHCVDVDGDSDLDLIVVNKLDHNISVLRNNGNGTF